MKTWLFQVGNAFLVTSLDRVIVSPRSDSMLQAQEEAELAQLRDARRRALEQRDAQMRQLDGLKARILAERYIHMLLPLSLSNEMMAHVCTHRVHRHAIG